MPFCTRSTRFGLSANTSIDCDQVQSLSAGRLSPIGLGQFGTAS